MAMQSSSVHKIRCEEVEKVIFMLIETWGAGCVKEKDEKGQTALHYGMKHDAPLAVMKVLVELYPEGVEEIDNATDHWTPLRIGTGYKLNVSCQSFEVMRLLIGSCQKIDSDVHNGPRKISALFAQIMRIARQTAEVTKAHKELAGIALVDAKRAAAEEKQLAAETAVNVSIEVAQCLLTACPEAAKQKDLIGLNALQYVVEQW
jgi:hypothetical protein